MLLLLHQLDSERNHRKEDNIGEQWSQKKNRIMKKEVKARRNSQQRPLSANVRLWKGIPHTDIQRCSGSIWVEEKEAGSIHERSQRCMERNTYSKRRKSEAPMRKFCAAPQLTKCADEAVIPKEVIRPSP